MNTDEVTRYQQFRQFRTEIRGSTDYLVIGIDVAKDKHHSFFGSAQGETFLRRLIFENNIRGFERLKSHIESIQAARSKQRVVLGLEPTGNYHKALGQWLIDQGHQLVLVTGKAVKENRESLIRVLLKSDLLRRIAIITAELKKGTVVETHTNKGYEWAYIFNGKAVVVVGNRRYPLEQGDAIFYDAPLPHSIKMEETARLIRH